MPQRPRTFVPESRRVQAAIKAVCETLRVPLERLQSRSRSRPVSYARRLLAYLLYDYAGLSYPQMAELLHKCHTSLCNGVATFRRELRLYGEVREDLAAAKTVMKHELRKHDRGT